MKNIINSIINWELWHKIQKPKKIEKDYRKDLASFSIDQIVEIRDHLNDMIRNYDDGFKYECRIRSYGRVWTEWFTNSRATQERCWDMNGDDGIIDVYTTNPELKLDNYGAVYYFPTVEDAKRWRDHRYNLKKVEEEFRSIADWENSSIPQERKAMFPPNYTKEQLLEAQNRLEEEKASIVNPKVL